MNRGQIPVSIITGFLGTGKTTLINKIIEKERDKKFAVIENEFSDMPIDGELISGLGENRIFELANGCICCTLGTELQETLQQLLNMDLDFNHLLIETTGIAEPDSIIQNIIANEEIKQNFIIQTVCCVIDALNFEEHIKEKENVKQLVVADTVVISKIENLSVSDLESLKRQIKEYNPLCIIVPVSYGDYGDFDLIENSFFNERSFKNLFSEVELSGHHEHHHPEISAVGIQINGNFDMKKFSFWMDYFLYINQNSIFRVKGILSFEGLSRKMVFQAVKSAYVIEEGVFWQSNEEKISKLIFIGKNLDKKAIKEGLNELIAD